MGGARTNASSIKANVNAAETKPNSSVKINNGKRVPDVKVSQSNAVDDLESIFSMGSRSSSVPKSRTTTMVKDMNIMSLNDFQYPHTIFTLFFIIISRRRAKGNLRCHQEFHQDPQPVR